MAALSERDLPREIASESLQPRPHIQALNHESGKARSTLPVVFAWQARAIYDGASLNFL